MTPFRCCGVSSFEDILVHAIQVMLQILLLDSGRGLNLQFVDLAIFIRRLSIFLLVKLLGSLSRGQNFGLSLALKLTILDAELCQVLKAFHLLEVSKDVWALKVEQQAVFFMLLRLQLNVSQLS